MDPNDLKEATPVSDPNAGVTLPVNQDTLVPHVESLRRRVKKLEDSGPKIVESVRVMLAKFLITVNGQWSDVAKMTRDQNVVLNRMDGGLWLMTRVIIPGIVTLAAAGWAIYTFYRGGK